MSCLLNCSPSHIYVKSAEQSCMNDTLLSKILTVCAGLKIDGSLSTNSPNSAIRLEMNLFIIRCAAYLHSFTLHFWL